MLANFLTRWVLSAVGLWVASGILGASHLSVGHTLASLIGAGFFLAVVNILLKPLLVFLSLPALILSLGLFMIVVNALVVLIASYIYSPLYVAGFWTAVWAGVIIGLVNFSISRLIEDFKR